jgi:hypothetical protein
LIGAQRRKAKDMDLRPAGAQRLIELLGRATKLELDWLGAWRLLAQCLKLMSRSSAQGAMDDEIIGWRLSVQDELD